MKIAQFVPGASWGAVNPDALESGIGGRESAAIYLAEAWSDAGHEVITFSRTSDLIHRMKPSGGQAHYIDIDMCAPMLSSLPFDVAVSYEEPSLFAVPGIREHCQVLICAMQVAHLNTQDPDILSLPDRWVALSPWHADFLRQQSPAIQNVSIFPNCVRLERFKKRTGRGKEGPALFMYASSPDRGLVHVLRSWPKIRQEFPGCELVVAYGVEAFVQGSRWSHSLQCEMALDIESGLKQEGINYVGKIGQTELAAWHSKADALLFPCDPMSPTETGCITVMEAAAAGSVPIITDADCLESEFSEIAQMVPLPYNEYKYLQAVKSVMYGDRTKLQKRGRKFVENRQWQPVSREWIKMFKQLGAGMAR